MDIIPDYREPSFSDKLALGLSNVGQTLGTVLPQRALHQQRQQALSQLIPGIENLHPEFQKMALEYKMKGDVEAKKRAADLAGDKHRSDTIRKYFGDQEADLYDVASEGGKTKIIEDLIETRARNKTFDEKFDQDLVEAGLPSAYGRQEGEQGAIEPKEISAKRLVDFDKGLTPKERTKRQDARYNTNLPLFEDVRTKKQAAEAEKDNLNILWDLSPKVSDLHRINLNPQSGDLFIPALASAEAQRYVKTINDFTRNAKDSYGARVTNFDLTQFMKRLPTLANSKKARADIIQQLQIINDINLLRQNALQDVIEEYGGIRNIDWDKAETLADKRIKNDIEKLRLNFKNIGNDIEEEYKNQINETKKKARPGYVAVRYNDGTLKEIPKENLKKFLDDRAGEQL